MAPGLAAALGDLAPAARSPGAWWSHLVATTINAERVFSGQGRSHLRARSSQNTLKGGSRYTHPVSRRLLSQALRVGKAQGLELFLEQNHRAQPIQRHPGRFVDGRAGLFGEEATLPGSGHGGLLCVAPAAPTALAGLSLLLFGLLASGQVDDLCSALRGNRFQFYPADPSLVNTQVGALRSDNGKAGSPGARSDMASLSNEDLAHNHLLHNSAVN